VALWAYAEEFGYSSGVWGTYRQWAEAGAQVRQGEKAAFVVFYKELAFATDPETGDTETAARLFARATPVFAAEQVDGFTPSTIGAPPVTTTPIEQAEAFVAATGASIHHGGGRAYYRPSTDSIHLPSRDAFIGTKTSTPAESQELHRRRSQERAQLLVRRRHGRCTLQSAAQKLPRQTRRRRQAEAHRSRRRPPQANHYPQRNPPRQTPMAANPRLTNKTVAPQRSRWSQGPSCQVS
jgi:antirestriction protein ArdC